MRHRSGYVAVAGRPNVGKSTLVNALVGEKISIVTSRPHTTRHAIMGVLSAEDCQLVFFDTPGLDGRRGRLLNRVMNQSAMAALGYADTVLFVVSAGDWREADERALEAVVATDRPCILAVNKIDRVRPRDRLLPLLADYAARGPFREVVPVSALRGENLGRLRAVLAAALPEQEALFSPATITDRDTRFRAAETLREKLMQSLREEVPYGLGVEIVALEEEPDGRLRIAATVWVDRESHKGMVVGKGGQRIKAVGQAARSELQELLGRGVRLESHVKVRRNWADDARALRELGYDGGP